MPKLKNVTNEELAALAELAFDVSQQVADCQQRASQGYAEEIKEPLQKASGFLSVSRTVADLAATLLTKAQLDEQKRELEKTLRGRA